MSPIKEPKFFLSDGPPPTKGGPGDALTYREHVWRRPDYAALFGAEPVGPVRGRTPPAARDASGLQAGGGGTGPGRAGSLQLGPPVVRGPGARRRLRPGLRRGGA